MAADSESDAREPDLTSADGLIEALEVQASLLIDVAIKSRLIDDAQTEYRDRRRLLIDHLKRRGLSYPFPWSDLWEWYGHWRSNLDTYAARRQHIRSLVGPTLEELEQQRAEAQILDPGSGLAGWAELDGRISGLATRVRDAATQDDFQDVGRRAREVLIDCARLIADPGLVPPGEPAPKAADARAWFDLFLAAHASGSSREEFRRLIRAAWDLAQKLTHADLGRIDAFAAAQATVLAVRTMQALVRENTPAHLAEAWERVLESLKPKVRAYYREAKPELSGSTLRLWFPYHFHYTQANTHLPEVEQLIRESLSLSVELHERV